MRRSRAFLTRFAVACVWLWSGTFTMARADEPATPCAANAPERAVAERELSAIDAAIEQLGVAANPKPLVTRLQALSETRCFALMESLELEPTSGLALKVWWHEGASAYVRAYLDLGRTNEPMLWVAPSVRRALTLDTDPKSPIRELLCHYADATCGAETRGWALRAEHDFAAMAAPPKSDEDCKELVSKAEPEGRLAAFRECQSDTRTTHASLPIGATRAPDHGWLILEGRRGHYSFCDETRAYDLATGSAYRVASCSGLALQAGGSVDFRATDARRKTVIELGHLPLQALREAAWMLLLLDSVDRHTRESLGVHIPGEIPLTTDGGFSSRGFGLSMHWTSGDTTLFWHVEHRHARPARLHGGDLRWSPEPLDDAPSEHAIALLRVAEAGMTLDCPEAPPPASLLAGEATLSASRLDADATSLDDAAQALRSWWHEARDRQRACASASPAPVEPRVR